MQKISLQQGTPEMQGKLPECPVHLMEQNSDYSEAPFFLAWGLIRLSEKAGNILQ
jgi:hypothetical protein